MWRRRLVGIATALAVIVLTACGGGTSSIAPATGVGPSNDAIAAPPAGLEITQAPTARIKQIDAAKGRDDLNLGDWQFEEPLQVVSDDTLSLPFFVKTCTPSNPLFGIWYLSLTNFSVAQQPVTIPACTFNSKGVSVANFYIIEVDVSLSGVVISTLSQPVQVDPNGEWTFSANAKEYSFAADNIYAFWVANYTGTGTPPYSTSTPL